MMDIGFVVYFLACTVAGVIAYRGGYRIRDWEYWAIIGCVASLLSATFGRD